MAALSISKAWEEASRFAAREFRLLFPIAFLLMALPNVLTGLLIPLDESPEMYELALFAQRNGLWTVLLLFVLLTLVVMLFSTFGSLAISWLALRSGSSVGEALGVARRRLLPVFGAVLLIVAAFALFALPLWLAILGPTSLETMVVTAPGRVLALLFPLMILGIAVGVKLLLLTPVGATEPLGPVGILARSWRLTTGHFWRLLGMLLLVGFVFMLIALVVGLIAGFPILATLGSPQVSRPAAFATDLVNALVTAITAMFMLPFITRIYAQLAATGEARLL